MIVGVGMGVFVLVGIWGRGVKVLVGMGVKVSVGVGLDISTSVADFCSGAARKPQARIKPTNTRIKGMSTSGILFIK
jgi:hypothetical protein